MARALPELEGRVLEAVTGEWVFDFGHGHVANIECDWRIVVDGRIVVARGDHNQLFGRNEPVNAIGEAERWLKGRRVVHAGFSDMGDLVIEFDRGRLEGFANSSGYESCAVWFPGARAIIVLGGGEVSEG